jgi:hypothetical protein
VSSFLFFFLFVCLSAFSVSRAGFPALCSAPLPLAAAAEPLLPAVWPEQVRGFSGQALVGFSGLIGAVFFIIGKFWLFLDCFVSFRLDFLCFFAFFCVLRRLRFSARCF